MNDEVMLELVRISEELGLYEIEDREHSRGYFVKYTCGGPSEGWGNRVSGEFTVDFSVNSDD